MAGGPGILPVAKDRYRRFGATAQFMSEDKFELNFLTADQFELQSMEGASAKYRRAVPYMPTASDLLALAGRYESQELKSVITMTHGKAGLMGKINDTRGDGYPFLAVERDAFQLGPLLLRFQRDPKGKVVGLDLTNPVVSKVRFTRVSDVPNGR